MMKKLNVLMWVVQVLLAALFLFAGGMKVVVPIEAMAMPLALPGGFLRFVGVAEVLGAVGLILPGLFRIHEELTPLAAAGLVVIMIGATIISAMMGPLAAVFPFVVGILCASVAVSRRPPVRQRIQQRLSYS